MRTRWLATAALVAALPAWAQEQPGPPAPASANTAAVAPADGPATSGLEDIVVTAQRRAESVQDVPIAIAAFTAGELETRGVTDALDLIQQVPNLFGNNNTGLGSANSYYLRGLGNTETIATFDPPVGTYVDDIYLSRQNANNISLFDVERVEVLRGPQGTLFGRNTTGGAISIILREPGDRFSGYAEGGFGRFGKWSVRGSVDVPLADTFAIKLSGFKEDDDGYVKNVTTGERLNDNDQWGARLGVRGELSDRVRWNASYARIVNKGENILNFTCDPRDQTRCSGRFATTGLREDGDGALFAPLVIAGDKAGYDQGNATGMNLVTSNLQIGVTDDLTVNLITGFVDLEQTFALDFFDGRAGPSLARPNPIVRGFTRGGFTILNDGEHRQFTQEVKANGSFGIVDFVTGFYYFDERNRTDFADVFTLGIVPGPSGFPLLLADRVLKNSTVAYAGYGQFDVNVTDAIKLTAGVRYTDETKTFNIRDNRPGCNDAVIEATCLENFNLRAANGAVIPDDQTTKLWTPRFAANFTPMDDVLLFASATKGFKSGGWNARGTTPGALLPFGPEEVWSYEVGAKTEFFDRRLRVNVTGYYSDVEALQTPSALVAPNGTISFITRNFADYENKGVEIEVAAVPFEGLNLYVNAGYQDDKYKIDRGADPVDEFGIQSVAAQQAACLAALAAGQIPQGANTAPAGTPPNNAPACAAGIVNALGQIAEPVRTPDWSLAIGGSYDLALGDDFTLRPSVNASYRSDYNTGTSELSFYDTPVTGVNGTYPANPFGTGDFIVGAEGDDYWLVNASLALTAYDGRYRVSVECENCFNEEYNQSNLGNYTYISPPGTWFVRARVGF